MEPWLSVGPSYNVHYIYLPGSVVLPECRPEGPPPAEHKAVKRFNSIRAAERRVGSNGGFIEFNASAGSALWKSPARITLPQHFNAPRVIRFYSPSVRILHTEFRSRSRSITYVCVVTYRPIYRDNTRLVISRDRHEISCPNLSVARFEEGRTIY